MSKLNYRFVENVTISGRYADGNGLYLLVKSSAQSSRKSWVFRYSSCISGTRRDMGLGSIDSVSLVQARQIALQLKSKLIDGVDPLEQADRLPKPRGGSRRKVSTVAIHTFESATQDFFERHKHTLKNEKYRLQWLSNMKRLILPALGHLAIHEVTTGRLLERIQPLALTTPDTARKLVIQVKQVFDDLRARDLITVNPVEKLKLSVKFARVSVKHHAALDWRKAPKVMKQILQCTQINAITKHAFFFGVLTATRTAEILGAKWLEMSTVDSTWTIPAARMKAAKAHQISLSSQAINILGLLRVQPRFSITEGLVFPSPTGPDKALSAMCFLMLLRRLGLNKSTTYHGLCRATFSTWAHENNLASPQVTESCLAHASGNKVAMAYNRGTFFEQRQKLLQEWADYLFSEISY
jgi:integrase